MSEYEIKGEAAKLAKELGRKIAALPRKNFEVDFLGGALERVSKSGRLVSLQDVLKIIDYYCDINAE